MTAEVIEITTMDALSEFYDRRRELTRTTHKIRFAFSSSPEAESEKMMTLLTGVEIWLRNCKWKQSMTLQDLLLQGSDEVVEEYEYVIDSFKASTNSSSLFVALYCCHQRTRRVFHVT